MQRAKLFTTIIVSGCLFICMLITPLLVAAGTVAVPVVAIHELFSFIGNIGSNEDDNDVTDLIESYLKTDDAKKLIQEVYKPLIKGKDIPLHHLVIPNLLAGIEDVGSELIKQQISIIEATESLEEYIDKLREKDPWKSAWEDISTTTIVIYIESFQAYLGEEESLDPGDIPMEKFLYPLKQRAIVTSEFGSRSPITLPNGEVTSTAHTGIDLAYPGGEAATCGVPIYAAMPGEVVANERTMSQAGANWGAIRYKNLEVWYLHMRDPFPYDVGTQIKKGQFVVYIGSSGLSTACHLHFETHVNDKAVNPRNFLDF